MKLSELLSFTGKNELTNDPDLIIELEEDNCLKYTGVIRASVYTDCNGRRHLCLLPASPVVRQDTEKTISWKNLK